jgi:hypothetical protein
MFGLSNEIVICDVPPTITLAGANALLTIGADKLIVVGSLAVSLAVFVSPPPLTLAVLVTVAGAFPATSTVSVIAG